MSDPNDKPILQGPVFQAFVEGNASNGGDRTRNITPTIVPVNTEKRLTLSYLGSDGLPYFQSLPVDDLVAAWRAVVLLPHLRKIERYNEGVQPGTLEDVYAIGQRSFLPWNQGYANKHLPGVCSGLIDQIMSTPVPEAIIRAIIDGQGKDGTPLLSVLTLEIQAGTIEWRQEFGDLGLTNPVDQKLQDSATLAHFEELLDSYSQHFDMQRHGIDMQLIETFLLGITKRGIELPEDLLVALAGLLASIQGIRQLLPRGKKSKSPLEMEQLAAKKNAFWLIKKNQPKVWHSFANTMTWVRYENLLMQLAQELMPPE